MKTSTGEDIVLLVEENVVSTWEVKFTDGTALEAAAPHIFPLKSGFGIINSDFPELNNVFNINRLNIGDVLWSGQKVESINKTGKKETVYSPYFSNDLIYFAGNIANLTANGVLATIIILENRNLVIDKKISEIKDFVCSFILPETRKNVLDKMYKALSLWKPDNFTKNCALYEDFIQLSKPFLSIINKESENSIKEVFQKIEKYEIKTKKENI
jgi:hypothetical protein